MLDRLSGGAVSGGSSAHHAAPAPSWRCRGALDPQVRRSTPHVVFPIGRIRRGRTVRRGAYRAVSPPRLGADRAPRGALFFTLIASAEPGRAGPIDTAFNRVPNRTAAYLEEPAWQSRFGGWHVQKLLPPPVAWFGVPWWATAHATRSKRPRQVVAGADAAGLGVVFLVLVLQVLLPAPGSPHYRIDNPISQQVMEPLNSPSVAP